MKESICQMLCVERTISIIMNIWTVYQQGEKMLGVTDMWILKEIRGLVE